MKENKVINTIQQIISDECYDFCDAYNEEFLTYIASVIIFALNEGKKDFCVYVVDSNCDTPIVFASTGDEEDWDFMFKIHNAYGSFISCSQWDSTGVSDYQVTLWDKYDEETLYDDCKYIIDMINEAWYLSLN